MLGSILSCLVLFSYVIPPAALCFPFFLPFDFTRNVHRYTVRYYSFDQATSCFDLRTRPFNNNRTASRFPGIHNNNNRQLNNIFFPWLSFYPAFPVSIFSIHNNDTVMAKRRRKRDRVIFHFDACTARHGRQEGIASLPTVDEMIALLYSKYLEEGFANLLHRTTGTTISLHRCRRRRRRRWCCDDDDETRICMIAFYRLASQSVTAPAQRERERK